MTGKQELVLQTDYEIVRPTLSFAIERFSFEERQVLEQIKFPEATFYVPQNDFTDQADVEAVATLYSQALESPMDFPAIETFVLKGDRVAIALLGNLPEPVESFEAIVGHLSRSVAGASVVAVISPMHSASFDKATCDRILLNNSSIDVSFCIHDPADQGRVACIGNNRAGEPVYVNREMFDADVVIPVGTLLEGSNKTDSFYPEFSSSEVLKRFSDRDSKVTKAELDGEVRQAENNLGAEFSVLVLRGPGGNTVGVRAGNRHSIKDSTNGEMDSMWSIQCQADGELVVATVEGESHQQTWEDIFNAIAAASAASQTVRQIVICSELDVEPDSDQMDILQLQFEVDLDAKCRMLGELSGVHYLIPSVLENTSVFLMSRLSQDTVEEAGLGYIESDREIQRIVDRAASGILLRDAHLCRVALE